MQPRLSVSLAFALAFALAGPASAVTPSFVADSGVDAVDATPGDGACDTGATPGTPVCSLRAAIQEANALGGADIFLLKGTYSLTLAGPGEDGALTGDLDVTTPIAISGLGSALTFIDGKKLKDRVFDVRPGGSLDLRKLTVENGRAPKPTADSSVTASGAGSGGCVRSESPLTLSAGSIFLFHCAAATAGGGASVLDGTATFSDSVFSTNQAKTAGGGLAALDAGSASFARVSFGANKAGTGGGLATGNATTLDDVTMDHNKAKLGGGLAVLGGAAATVTSSTLTENGSVNLDASQGSASVTNTILWGAKQSDCLGAVTTGGGNLEGGTSCGFTGTHDQQSTDPQLAMLANYGGLVPTRALASTSPAIDHGNDVADICKSTDARNGLRIAHTSNPLAITDTGAYEFGGRNAHDPVTITSTPVLTATVGVLYTYDVDATPSPERQTCPLTFTLATPDPVNQPLPDGLAIDAATGVITWTPAADQAKAWNVIANVTDGAIGDGQAFTITVSP